MKKNQVLTKGNKMGRKALNMDSQTKKYYLAYKNQKWLAKNYRNIEWHFTYESWLAWWGDDIVNRGKGKDKLVMARYGDQGPYHPDNVRKATHGENITEARSKCVNTPKGIFKTVKDACNHYGLTSGGIYGRMKKYPTEYYYL